MYNQTLWPPTHINVRWLKNSADSQMSGKKMCLLSRDKSTHSVYSETKCGDDLFCVNKVGRGTVLNSSLKTLLVSSSSYT